MILLNVARHEHLALAVAQSSHATDALVDLMQMFRDKKSIFILSCELLTRLVRACNDVKVGFRATIMLLEVLLPP